jgi:branched-chain amino acid transport system ATP-binding protein
MTGAPPPDALLSVRDVSLSFRGVQALNGLSFDIARGEICSLIGPNGAGKSSLLNLVNGVYWPDSGSIAFDGRSYRRLRAHQAAMLGIARTFQNNALFRNLSVLDNVLTGLSRHGRASVASHLLRLPAARREERGFRERAEDVLDFLHIAAYRDAIVGKLPYGLQKRVELGRALVSHPGFILLDEPMAGMNDAEKAEMSRFILDINRDLGVTVLLIEHDIGVVMNLSDHVVVLDYGRKVGDGSPAEVRANPDVIAAYLGTRH